MQWKGGKELRELFLRFFEERGHKRYPSFSLIPDDPSLLFTIAGMVPFKPYFLGEKTPEVTRATTAQKCIRTNDIENVGYTARHHTFFEMLGNFSFGDYFKEEAIQWGWEFLTSPKWVGLDPDRMWITIYKDDDEAFEIWNKKIGIAKDRIVRMGEEDNFWKVGPVGPCGPCSELIYDQGPVVPCDNPNCGVDCDCDRYLEIWNLVFMQYNRQEDGSLEPLPKKNIDTGMGLERLSSLVQGVTNDFETDLFKPILEHVATIAGVRYGTDSKVDVALKVISDHIRALCFMIADGVLPSNEGRGYVLRRVLRRAVRFATLIGLERNFMKDIVPTVIKVMSDPYIELVKNRATIEQIIDIEEKRFRKTLEQGTMLLTQEINKLKSRGEKKLSGEIAFVLYDTYGFPLELTKEICSEEGITVDEEGFEIQMQKQRERARSALKDQVGSGKEIYNKLVSEHGATKFVGYTDLEAEAEVIALIKGGEVVDKLSEGEEGEVILNVTPFYAEKGGQVGDTGILENDLVKAQVYDTVMPVDDLHVHKVKIISGEINKKDKVKALVDVERRWAIRRHHTATHLLHRALESVIGEHARQAGSLVGPDYLRFDFTHYAPLSAEEIKEIEKLVNKKIMENIPLEVVVMSKEEAEKLGAKALFEEKYGEKVRVIKIGDYSLELCGGTHVDATGDIGMFKIYREEGIGSGLRRIFAYAGEPALRYFQQLEDIVSASSKLLSVDGPKVPPKIEDMLSDIKEKDKTIKDLKLKLALTKVDSIVAQRQVVGDIAIVTGVFKDLDETMLRQVGDVIKNKLKGVVVVLGSVADDKVALISMADDIAIQKGVHAGKLIKEVAKIVGGGGGGRDNMAQAGGKYPDKLDEALGSVPRILQNQLNL